jgi:signal transduction histidine kinase
MVNDLLHFTSERDPQRCSFPLGKLVEELLGSLAPQLAAQSIRAEAEVPDDQLVTADRDMLRRALLNLLLNAVDAMPDGGTVSIRARQSPAGAVIEVADSGLGLSQTARRRAFEPFYTTKPGGTGLGLAIVYRIAEAHGGEVRAANRPDSGAVFTLRIPSPAQEAAA